MFSFIPWKKHNSFRLEREKWSLSRINFPSPLARDLIQVSLSSSVVVGGSEVIGTFRFIFRMLCLNSFNRLRNHSFESNLLELEHRLLCRSLPVSSFNAALMSLEMQTALGWIKTISRALCFWRTMVKTWSLIYGSTFWSDNHYAWLIDHSTELLIAGAISTVRPGQADIKLITIEPRAQCGFGGRPEASITLETFRMANKYLWTIPSSELAL